MARILLLLSFIFIFSTVEGQSYSRAKKVNLQWQLNYQVPGNPKPGSVAAIVPGAIQLDIARAEGYGLWFYGQNWKNYLWMEDQYFTYRTDFNKPETNARDRVFFVSKGIDYEFDLILNNTTILHQEGMFTPVSIDITDLLKEKNNLQVKIYPVPKTHSLPADRSQAAQSVKPAASYGWDWHPRLIPSGIWDDTFLEVRPAVYIHDAHVTYVLSNDLNRVDVRIDIEGSHLDEADIIWKIRDSKDQVVASKIIQSSEDNLSSFMVLENPILWWPHDHGTPYLYSSVVELRGVDNLLLHSEIKQFGFRRIRMVMNEGAWSEPAGFPKSRSAAPAQLEINGRKIFCKGSNWVNADVFPGTLTAKRYNDLTDRVVEANFNMLRIWGGGLVNKEAFYDQCDAKGILVWQEFPLACNNYEGTPEYLSVLKQEATSIIRRLRSHPCLAIWSGGNELFNSWSGMTDQSIALRMLNSMCLEMDPYTPFIATSPLEGMGHGHYVFRDDDTGEEVFSLMSRAKNTAYTEFGIPSPSSVELLKRIIPEREIWPPARGGSWESHHAFNSWTRNTWLMQGMIEDYFGPSPNLQTLVTNGQLLQAEGYKAIFEEARRQKPLCSMALNWCFNEPWPTAANNNIISYPDQPKPAFYAVKNSCRPVLASARISKFEWHEGEVFSSDIFLLNDSYNSVAPGTIRVTLRAGTESVEFLEWDFGTIKENTNKAGPTARMVLPRWNTDRITLQVTVDGHPEYNSEYLLLYRAR